MRPTNRRHDPRSPCSLAVGCSSPRSAGAAVIGIYRNSDGAEGPARRRSSSSPGRAARRRLDHALRIVVGKAHQGVRLPHPGARPRPRDRRDRATAQGTPKPVQRKAFLASTCAPGAGARYQLAVFPLQRKAQLRKLHRRRQDRSTCDVKNEGDPHQGPQPGQQAAPARLQRHQGRRKGQLPHPRLRRRPAGRRRHRPAPRASSEGRYPGFSVGAVEAAPRAPWPASTTRRPRPQPVLALSPHNPAAMSTTTSSSRARPGPAPGWVETGG